mmetsp:Transcript_5729/g.19503  ORF Transcript_5729/g.19503 Transcript_5729/m.19503 type:complete len:117 (+) Transcript_5729:1560-1910(+)
MSISLKSFGNENGIHSMLRPRSWWHALFEKYGARVDNEILCKLQENVAELYPEPTVIQCRKEGQEDDGGTYTVCNARAPWLVGLASQANLRMSRCYTKDDGDLEPWIFAFRVDKVP